MAYNSMMLRTPNLYYYVNKTEINYIAYNDMIEMFTIGNNLRILLILRIIFLLI